VPARDEGPAETVENYLASLPEPERKTLARLRGQIRNAAPEASEVISYRIPTYRLHGPLVHFAAPRNHLSLTVVSLSVLETFRAELRGFDVSGRAARHQPRTTWLACGAISPGPSPVPRQKPSTKRTVESAERHQHASSDDVILRPATPGPLSGR
jgi:uncharacterized protein YdhG (YjbR/CyaY superfamily)